MCAEKNFLLDIASDEGQNLLTFTVRARPSRFFKHIRVPLISALVAYLGQQVYEISKNWRDYTIGLSYAVTNKLPADTSMSYGLYRYIVHFGVICLLVLLVSIQEQSDSLMVMGDLGIQLSSRKRWIFANAGSDKEFIPLSDIIDIVIHEGFHGYGQVIFYMCVLTKAKEGGNTQGNGIKVIFPNFLPRKDMLLQVWKQSRKLLYGNARRHFRRVPGQGLREIKHLHE